ncbi:MAG: hypothetical protein ACYC3F_16705 [Gemmatimonadaceae bacterium]
MGSLFEYKKIFVIDSSERTSGTNTNFSFSLPLEPGLNFNKIALQDILIPRTMYLIRAGLNTMTLRENGVDATVTLPVGTYSYISFQTVITPLLGAASPNGLTYTLAFPALNAATQTYKFTFTQNNGAIQSSFIFGNGLAEQFGFDKGSTNAFSGTTLVSANSINFGLLDACYLLCNGVRGSNYNSILQEIYMTGPSMSNFYWQNFNIDATSRDLLTNDTNDYTFTLVDEDFNEIDLNGANIIFTIMLYRESVFQRLARAFFLSAQYWLAKASGSIDPIWPGEQPDYGAT